ncbi:MAG: DUF1304 domain-containing protein [Saprospiraceae bacterium]|nr:DUF1304 domain-containing protein [Saprospiraceae bacterium]MCB9319670.1 DUF1304 domain-containing protein [Lewinellaceae bacterium]
MKIAIDLITALVGILHLYFMYFEMFAWMTTGRRIFKKYPTEFFKQSKSLAANQGLYNGFLAAGLFWTFLIHDDNWQSNIRIFFLSCVAIAGIYGALTADRKIFFVQALPALIGLILLAFN